MIAVIADDFAGAAELAGIGFTRGLAGEVHAEPDIASTADLVVLDTDTRSCPSAEAARRVADAARAIERHAPAWVFKKVDSVLRGPVLAEVREMTAATGKRRAILVPANPSRGRIIRDGQYFIDGRPIDQSAFAADPEYPVRSADVLEMLDARGNADVCVRRADEDLPDRGVIVGEAATTADLARWAERVDPPTLAAGAAEFFAALLEIQRLKVSTVGNALRGVPRIAREAPAVTQGTPRRAFPTHDAIGIAQDRIETLFVCGSAAGWTSGRGEQCAEHGVPVVLAPCLTNDVSPGDIVPCVAATIAALQKHGAAMIALDSPSRPSLATPRLLLGPLIDVVVQVLGRRGAGRLFVEGGATASVLMRRMGWKRGRVCRQYAEGVVGLEVQTRPSVIVTVKPGSYPWPEDVWATP